MQPAVAHKPHGLAGASRRVNHLDLKCSVIHKNSNQSFSAERRGFNDDFSHPLESFNHLIQSSIRWLQASAVASDAPQAWTVIHYFHNLYKCETLIARIKFDTVASLCDSLAFGPLTTFYWWQSCVSTDVGFRRGFGDLKRLFTPAKGKQAAIRSEQTDQSLMCFHSHAFFALLTWK